MTRPRLGHLKGFAQSPVSLVCAPAGYGKTTFVAEWAHGPDVDGRVAWVSLDDGHNETFRFWMDVIRAVASVSTGDVAEVLGRLRPPRQASESAFISVLAEAVGTIPGTRWLVLDDVHQLREPQLIADLDRMLTARTEALRFVLVGRTDPSFATARLRVSGELSEIRAPELAFDLAESEVLLSQLGIALDATDLADLQARTEGWAAGLRLAAVSLADSTDQHAAVSSFAGDDRAVADYLFGEVFRQLAPRTRDFLMATCVPEVLTVSLAHELSARRDAGAVLDQLCQANALVLESGRKLSYRYHGLLRGYLMAALARRDPEALAAQHRRVAQWLVDHGRQREGLIIALSGADAGTVTEIAEVCGPALILDGQAELVLRAVRHIDNRANWPAGAALGALAALAALELGQLAVADEFLAIARSQDHAAPIVNRLVGVAGVQRALLGGDVPAELEGTKITEWELSGDPDVDLLVLSYRGSARMRLGEYEQAVTDLERSLQLAEAGGHDEMALWILSQLSGVTGSACDFTAMKAWSDKAIDFARPRGWADSPRLAYAYLLAAWTGFQTGQTGEQKYFAERAIHCLDPVTNVEVALGVRSMAALAKFESAAGRERHDAARLFHELWQDSTTDQVSPALNSFATPQEVRLALSVGEHRWAEEAVRRVERQLPHSAESLTLLATLQAARGRESEALQSLRLARSSGVEVHVRTTLVAADVLAWRLHHHRGDAALAHQSLEQALDWAAPRNYRRPFLEVADQIQNELWAGLGRYGRAEPFVEHLRAQMADGQEATTRRMPAPIVLTVREQELLKDLSSLLAIAEIATARMISVNTVKTHVASIYRKLGVPNRREAVMEAARIGLL
ncbi:LuxR C-terminal-related transcriptional regulator [Nakamurella lactea]|uniref:LuxR C-terminal-related transcriptional regulator n=1 Tax=Nakamurella lactea TaxID=459515 RepID=UPI00048D7BA6|nr:LuxR C-terminal-related transcriptional regulator [Nakamurella lactea]